MDSHSVSECSPIITPIFQEIENGGLLICDYGIARDRKLEYFL
jgi:hypothetical protein